MGALALLVSSCSSDGKATTAAPEVTKPTVTTAPAAALTRQEPRRRWVMGFYPEYQRDLMAPAEIDWTAMTHVAVGRVVPKADGTLDQTFDYDETHGPALARDLATRARANGVTPILMVGGAGTHDEFAKAASSNGKNLATNLVTTMRRLGFAGLELDWEPISDADQKPLAALVAELRRAEPGITLSLSVAWVSTTFPNVSPFYARLAPQLDQINVMTYGMAGAWDGWKTWFTSALDGAGDPTPSSIAVNVQSYLAAGVPAPKLGLGVGFYGQCWSGGVSGPRQDIGTSKLVAEDNDMSYLNIMSMYFQQSAFHYDSEAQQPYLGYAAPRGPKQCTYISYENAESIAAKGAYARSHGLGGAIVWTINQAHLRDSPPAQRDALLKTTRTAFGA
jgi:chitinase